MESLLIPVLRFYDEPIMSIPSSQHALSWTISFLYESSGLSKINYIKSDKHTCDTFLSSSFRLLYISVYHACMNHIPLTDQRMAAALSSIPVCILASAF
jgi:hypothetical protein